MPTAPEARPGARPRRGSGDGRVFSEAISVSGDGFVRVFSEATTKGYFRETVFSEVDGRRVVSHSVGNRLHLDKAVDAGGLAWAPIAAVMNPRTRTA